jgi:uncharacterized protein (DUF952 family)
MIIYHLITGQALEAARQSGSHTTDSLHTEGFIHFSQAHQVAGVANKYYRTTPDLYVLYVETEHLSAPLKFEPPAHPAGGDTAQPDPHGLFPHLYGPLNMAAVIKAVPFVPGPGGMYQFP